MHGVKLPCCSLCAATGAQLPRKRRSLRAQMSWKVFELHCSGAAVSLFTVRTTLPHVAVADLQDDQYVSPRLELENIISQLDDRSVEGLLKALKQKLPATRYPALQLLVNGSRTSLHQNSQALQLPQLLSCCVSKANSTDCFKTLLLTQVTSSFVLVLRCMQVPIRHNNQSLLFRQAWHVHHLKSFNNSRVGMLLQSHDDGRAA